MRRLIKIIGHLFWWPIDACIGQEQGRFPWSKLIENSREPKFKDKKQNE